MKEQQQGSGSAENKGQGREQQVSQGAQPGKQEVSREAGISRRDVSSIEELGGRSGRDDYSGGSGDDMESQSTGSATDR
ncbi:MAG: hypothetical protein EOO16_15145 [Chitinophagaceae bacterium]|nr:MAG: hypothetical protein EOO16_15145 [Chitinophagaceae bacterium]